MAPEATQPGIPIEVDQILQKPTPTQPDGRQPDAGPGTVAPPAVRAAEVPLGSTHERSGQAPAKPGGAQSTKREGPGELDAAKLPRVEVPGRRTGPGRGPTRVKLADADGTPDEPGQGPQTRAATADQPAARRGLANDQSVQTPVADKAQVRERRQPVFAEPPGEQAHTDQRTGAEPGAGQSFESDQRGQQPGSKPGSELATPNEPAPAAQRPAAQQADAPRVEEPPVQVFAPADEGTSPDNASVEDRSAPQHAVGEGIGADDTGLVADGEVPGAEDHIIVNPARDQRTATATGGSEGGAHGQEGVNEREFLENLQGKVDRAVFASPREAHTPDKKGIVSQIREKEAKNEGFRNFPLEERLSLLGDDVQPWQVVIEEQSHYKALVRMGIRALVADLGEYRSEEYIEATARKIVAHELDHATEALEDPGLHVEYGIGFYRDEQDTLSIQGFVILKGKTTLEKYRKIIGAGDLSKGDEAELGRNSGVPEQEDFELADAAEKPVVDAGESIDIDHGGNLYVLTAGSGRRLDVIFYPNSSKYGEPTVTTYITSIDETDKISGTTTALYAKARKIMQQEADERGISFRYTLRTDIDEMIDWAMDLEKGQAIFQWDTDSISDKRNKPPEDGRTQVHLFNASVIIHPENNGDTGDTAPLQSNIPAAGVPGQGRPGTDLTNAVGGAGSGNGGAETAQEEFGENSKEVVDRVRGIVEDALLNSFGRNTDTYINSFQGNLSTDPQDVDPTVTWSILKNMCGPFSDELHKNLLELENPLPTVISISGSRDSYKHNYLVANIDGVEVLIDPSIGQYLDGHNHTFVGTREELRDLVVNQTGEGKPYAIINTSSRNNPPEAFERTWGNTSRPFRQTKAEAAFYNPRTEEEEPIRDFKFGTGANDAGTAEATVAPEQGRSADELLAQKSRELKEGIISMGTSIEQSSLSDLILTRTYPLLQRDLEISDKVDFSVFINDQIKTFENQVQPDTSLASDPKIDDILNAVALNGRLVLYRAMHRNIPETVELHLGLLSRLRKQHRVDTRNLVSEIKEIALVGVKSSAAKGWGEVLEFIKERELDQPLKSASEEERIAPDGQSDGLRSVVSAGEPELSADAVGRGGTGDGGEKLNTGFDNPDDDNGSDASSDASMKKLLCKGGNILKKIFVGPPPKKYDRASQPDTIVTKSVVKHLGKPRIDYDLYRRLVQEEFGISEPSTLKLFGRFWFSQQLGLHNPLKRKTFLNVVATEFHGKRKRFGNRKKHSTAQVLAHETQHDADNVNHPTRSRLEATARGIVLAAGGVADHFLKADLITSFLIPLSAYAGYHLVDPQERRARKTEKNEELVNKFEEVIVFGEEEQEPSANPGAAKDLSAGAPGQETQVEAINRPISISELKRYIKKLEHLRSLFSKESSHIVRTPEGDKVVNILAGKQVGNGFDYEYISVIRDPLSEERFSRISHKRIVGTPPSDEPEPIRSECVTIRTIFEPRQGGRDRMIPTGEVRIDQGIMLRNPQTQQYEYVSTLDIDAPVEPRDFREHINVLNLAKRWNRIR